MAGLVLGNVGVPIPAAAILFVAMTAYWTALGAGLSHLLQRGGVAGVFGAAGLLTLGEWAQSVALPMFGTAQRLASAWVEYDAARLPARFGGTLLITFLVGTAAFATTEWLRRRARACSRRDSAPTPASPSARPEGRLRDFQIIGMVAGAVLLITGLIMNRCFGPSDSERFSEHITVAVCGSKSAAGAFMDPEFFLKKYRPMLAEAAAKGAKLVVTPEMGLFVKEQERDAVLARFAEEARSLGVAWALGYAQSGPSLNRAVLLNADKPVGESYDKTRWVPFMETYARHGDARAVTGTVAGVKVGLMICQDDNYEEVARNLSLAGVQVVAVPTFDWKGVEHAHLQSARNRPRESGFVEARAAIGGVSAIIDPAGKILAARNHFTEGDGMTFATVTIDGGSPTVFARLGNIPVLALSGLLVANALRRRRTPGGDSAQAGL